MDTFNKIGEGIMFFIKKPELYQTVIALSSIQNNPQIYPKKLKKDDLPRYFFYELGIKDYRKFFKTLKRLRYIKIRKRFYSITRKGIRVVNKNPLLVKFHYYFKGNSFIRPEEFIEFVNNSKLKGFNDILWSLYSKKQFEAMKNKDLSTYTFLQLEMARFLQKEGKNKKALQLYISYLYSYLNEYDDILIPTGIYLNILELKNSFDDTMIDNKYLSDFIKRYNVSKKEYKDIILHILSNDKEWLRNNKMLDDSSIEVIEKAIIKNDK